MRKSVAFFFLLSFILVSFKINERLFFIPKGWQKPVYDFSKNELSANKIFIGRSLFYDPILSKNNTISCASCHSSYNAFAHTDHALSHGIFDRIGKRNAPGLMNLAWQNSFMWDGAIHHLDVQSLAPLSDSLEMNEDFNHVILKLNQSDFYKKLFLKTYRDSLITGERTLKCLTQFMLTLVTADSKYDQVLRKKSSFTNQEKAGYILFQKNCASCHQEPLFSTYNFETNGLKMDSFLKDLGRMNVTHLASDSLKFKIPTLRNIEYTYPYMHDGRFPKLMDVLNHYTTSVQPYPNLPIQLQQKITLTSNEKVDLIAFLLTLSDKKFVFNPNFQFPKKNLF